MDKKEIRHIVDKFHQAVTGRGVRIEKILLYGSAAGNRSREDSDIDLAVISKDFGRDRLGEGTLLMQIAWRVDPRIHPVPVSAKSYLHDTWIPLIHEIREHGIEIP
jgi:uncharacterized protein